HSTATGFAPRAMISPRIAAITSAPAGGKGERGPTAQRELPPAEWAGDASAQAKGPASTWATRASARPRERSCRSCHSVGESRALRMRECDRDGVGHGVLGDRRIERDEERKHLLNRVFVRAA